MSLRWCPGFCGNWQYVSCCKFIHGDHWPVGDAGEQFGLLGLEVCQQAENMEQIDQLGRVIGAPGRGLDLLQRGGSPGAHRGALPVPATVAEPLVQHIDPGDVIFVHPWRDIANAAAADAQFVCLGVVAERVRHVLGVAGNGIAAEDMGCPVVRQPRRRLRPAIGRVAETLAIAVQPQHSLAECDSTSEHLRVGGQGNAETWYR